MHAVRGFVALGLVSLLSLIAVSATAPREARWWRGNTHTHTLWSDGDQAPEMVAAGYKAAGYHFLVLSDHNVLLEGVKKKKVGTGKGEVPPHAVLPGSTTEEKDGATWLVLKTLDEVRSGVDEAGRFLMIPGEELSDKLMLPDGKESPVHHNVINHTHLIKPPGGTSIREILERTIQAVEEEAARSGRTVLVHLNHPNFHWAVSPDDIAHVLGERFFEVYNGHRGVRNYGDETHKSTEQIWDYVLSIRLGRLGGPPLFALATDDAHHYHQKNAVANMRRGWIQVRAESLDADSILKAMRRGDFYASSGVALDDVVRSGDRLALKIAAEPGVTYATKFIGTRKGSDKFGEVLAEVEGATPSYTLKGDELYVRATVTSSRKHPNGYDGADFESAWTQPLTK